MDDSKKMMTIEKVSHYHSRAYNSKERFTCYWHQINEILTLNPDNVLEVGIGSGFVSNYLKAKGVKAQTIDIDFRLQPDLVGNVLNLPFRDDAFPVVASYELLEHLPFQYFQQALCEILRVSNDTVILSLPDVTPVYRLLIDMPRMKSIRKLIRHPFRKATQKKSYEGHCWEIGIRDFPLVKICHCIISSGSNIVKTYRVFESYRHRFFLLKKT